MTNDAAGQTAAGEEWRVNWTPMAATLRGPDGTAYSLAELPIYLNDLESQLRDAKAEAAGNKAKAELADEIAGLITIVSGATPSAFLEPEPSRFWIDFKARYDALDKEAGG